MTSLSCLLLLGKCVTRRYLSQFSLSSEILVLFSFDEYFLSPSESYPHFLNNLISGDVSIFIQFGNVVDHRPHDEIK